MATVSDLTNRLLQERIGLDLDQFVLRHIADGGDATSLQGALMIATGCMYDRRTTQTWITKYTRSTNA